MIYIPASSVSAILGRNKYESASKATIRVLEKYNKGLYRKLINAYQLERYYYKPICNTISAELQFETYKETYDSLIKDETIAEQIKSLDIVKPNKNTVTFDSIIDTKYNQFKTTNQSIIDNITNDCNITTDEIDVLQLDADIKRKIVMDRGAVREHKIAEKLKQMLGEVSYDPSHVYSIRKTCKLNKYKLGGRIDLYLLTNGVKIGVIEIKSRVSGMYNKSTMPIYDVDQLTIYRTILNLAKYYIVQEYKGEIKIVEYSKPELDKQWYEIQPLLDQWVDMVASIRDKPYQKELFNMIDESTITLDK